MREWAELEVLSAMVFGWLLKLNVLNNDDEPRKLLDQHRQMNLAQLSYETLRMTPLSRGDGAQAQYNACADLPAEMIANVNDVGENRRRERDARERGNDENDG
jgi:hypothetical protein